MSDEEEVFPDLPRNSALFTAHVAACLEFGAVHKDSSGYGYNYADLATVRAAVVPVLAKHGLTVIQLPTTGNAESIGVRTILGHVSGESVESTCRIKVADHKGMSFEQCAGTAITYLRRYALLAVCGLAPEDNDAAAPRDDAPKGRKGGW